jgi:hypothetical protein
MLFYLIACQFGGAADATQNSIDASSDLYASSFGGDANAT